MTFKHGDKTIVGKATMDPHYSGYFTLLVLLSFFEDLRTM